jgi:hypothetical protein
MRAFRRGFVSGVCPADEAKAGRLKGENPA